MPLSEDDLRDLVCLLRDISEVLDREVDIINNEIQRLVVEANILESEM